MVTLPSRQDLLKYLGVLGGPRDLGDPKKKKRAVNKSVDLFVNAIVKE